MVSMNPSTRFDSSRENRSILSLVSKKYSQVKIFDQKKKEELVIIGQVVVNYDLQFYDSQAIIP